MIGIDNNINMLQADKLTNLQAGQPPEGTGKLASLSAGKQTPGDSDAKTASKQIETVFLNELLRIMMEQTSFGKDETVSTYLPAITSELSKSLAERGGIGVANFILKGNGLARYKIENRRSGGDTGNDKNVEKKVNILRNPPI